MKKILATCLLFLSLHSVGSAQAQRRTALTRAETKEAERLLNEMGYWTGPVDGVIDTATKSALIAFQKWEDRPISGKLTRDELEAIRSATPPAAREQGYEHVEVDVDRQVLMLVSENDSVKVIPVSTGNNKEYLDEGQMSIAYTPRGRFVVYDKTFGWEGGQVGSVFYANYITGSVAIHGYLSVPTHPASHGCIRVPMFAARELSKLTPLGTIVLIYDKVSFVSAKDWVKNPKLKEAAFANAVLQ